MLKLLEIRKNYNSRRLLDIDFLEMERGKIYCVSGPNGSGKTTLLKIMAFIIRPDSGKVLLNDKIINRKNAFFFRRAVSFVNQDPYVFKASVLDNIAIGLNIKNRHNELKYIEDSADSMGMSGILNESHQSLSSGEKYKIGILRMAVLHREIVILDEPTANLDKSAVNNLVEWLLKWRDMGNLIIFASHNRGFISKTADIELKIVNKNLEILKKNMKFI